MEKNEKLTITLTGRRPVKINKDEWPILAKASRNDFDGQYDFQSNRTTDWKLIVRQHADGRAIVYGIFEHDTHFQNENNYWLRGGELVDKPADLIAAIQRVAANLESRQPSGKHWKTGVFTGLAHECIADLPADEL